MTSKVYAARRQEIDEEDIPVEEQVERMRARLAMNYSYVILPNHKYLQRWDLVTMLALIFTALVTPVEVGFTSKALGITDALFIVNRSVDLVFICDLILQFNLSYRDELKGGQLIKSRKAIARRYLRGWFSVDFVSVIPFELLPVPPSFKMMRLIRLLRLLKLARVLKASRMLARYETVIDLTYAQRDMVKFSIMIIVMAHWLACLWGLVDTMARGPRDTDTMTWVTYALKSWDHEADAEGNFDTSYSFDIASVHDRYVVSLYFVMYMLTSIGFGDISATTMPEYYVCTLMMVVSAIFWAYVVGNFCSIMSTADVFGIEFKQRMDELNYMMNERHFDAELKKRCRMFYIESKQVRARARLRERARARARIPSALNLILLLLLTPERSPLARSLSPRARARRRSACSTTASSRPRCRCRCAARSRWRTTKRGCASSGTSRARATRSSLSSRRACCRSCSRRPRSSTSRARFTCSAAASPRARACRSPRARCGASTLCSTTRRSPTASPRARSRTPRCSR